MRRKSKKRQRDDAAADELRLLFRHERAGDSCWCCHRCPPCDIHEIACGAGRAKAIHERSAWLFLCRSCHDGIQGSADIAGQLAIKMENDPEHYDRALVNLLRGRQPNAIDERDVAIAVASRFKQARHGSTSSA